MPAEKKRRWRKDLRERSGFGGIFQFSIIVPLTITLIYLLPATVFAAVPGRVTLSTPLNGAVNVSSAPTLRWNAVTRATQYQVEVFRREANNTRTFVLRQNATVTNLLVRRPFLTVPERRDLRTSTTYFWRVRARNASGFGLWSAERAFTTSRRNVWSPIDTIVDVVHLSTANRDEKWVSKSWNQEAVDWIRREQSWFVPGTKELNWEHELRAPNLTTNFWSSVVGTTFFSDLPHPVFEWDPTDDPDEFDFRSNRPEQIVAGRYYISDIMFNTVSGRPSSINALIESEIFDWTARQAWFDEVGSMPIPGYRRFIP
ncbi:MAG: fibronectin type III domain-containing protein [Dethiobacter sp.]|jgi:hypothetical protein|nr:fibronectin type III domain-containing protein [Dethiobacter sp.]